MDLEDEIADEMGDDTDTDTETPADDDTEQTEEQAAEEQPAEEQEPDSRAIIEQRDREWERVTKYLAKNLGEIEQDDAVNYVECPVCRAFGTPGFVLPQPPPPEVLGVLHQWLGMRPNDEYRADDYSRECPKCDGLGETLTGSKVPGRDKLPCYDCQGDGWIAVGEERRKDRLVTPNGASFLATEAPAIGYAPPQLDSEVPPEVAALREQGYTVIAPFVHNP